MMSKFVQHGQKSFSTKGKTYPIKEFPNCSSDHVVYCLTCPCGFLYVGRTIHPLRQRFGKHRWFIEQGCDEHHVPRHFLTEHQKSTKGLKVWVIKAISGGLPAVELFKRLCQRETFWINSLSPGGLNEELDAYTLL